MVAGLAATSALSVSAGFSSPQRLFANVTSAPEYPFEIVASSDSGIEWTHANERSPEKYLPESTGPGCAFFDYDNDGWMDI